MKSLHSVAYVLLWVGGINWGLVGLFNYNLLGMLLGGAPALLRLVYVLVGASAVYLCAGHKGYCKNCGGGK